MPVVPDYLYHLEHPVETTRILERSVASAFITGNNSSFLNTTQLSFAENADADGYQEYMKSQSVAMGMLFGSGGISQIIANMFLVKPLIER